jgi:hypothetical protein
MWLVLFVQEIALTLPTNCPLLSSRLRHHWRVFLLRKREMLQECQAQPPACVHLAGGASPPPHL